MILICLGYLQRNILARIAAVVPIGPIDRMGYQYNYELCLRNLAKNFDFVYLISNKSQDIKTFGLKNVVVIMNENTLFKIHNNVEIFDMQQIFDNVHIAMNQAKKDGNHYAVQLSINNYVENGFRSAILTEIKKKLTNKAWGWLYKAYQVRDEITEPSVRVPYIINLKYLSDITFKADSICYRSETIRIEDGFWKLKKNPYIVDIFGDYNESDFKEKWDYYEQNLYSFLNIQPKMPNWAHRIAYLNAKLKNKFFSKKVDSIGLQAYKNLPKDSAVNQLEDVPKYTYLQTIKHVIRILKKKFYLFSFNTFLIRIFL